jgi:hypothetical protein
MAEKLSSERSISWINLRDLECSTEELLIQLSRGRGR